MKLSDFGVLFDGYDETAKVQAALDDPCVDLDVNEGVVFIAGNLVANRLKRFHGPLSINHCQATGVAQPAIAFRGASAGSKVEQILINQSWGAVTAPPTAGIFGIVSIEADGIILDRYRVRGTKTPPAPGIRASGLEILANEARISDPDIASVSGYGIHGLTWVAPWPSALRNITIRGARVTDIGDGYGISIGSAAGSVSGLRLHDCRVDISAEPASSTKNAIFVGNMNNTCPSEDILIDGCSVLANPRPDNTTHGAITVGNGRLARVANCTVKGGGIGISIADGYCNSVTGNTIDMQGGYNPAQGNIGYGIEIAGSQVACSGNAIEGHATLMKGVAIQSSNPIYNVNVGPNNIQGCLARIYQQPGHPGPFRIVDP